MQKLDAVQLLRVHGTIYCLKSNEFSIELKPQQHPNSIFIFRKLIIKF